MNAIILAAGKSSRLYPLTENKPKSLLLFNGKPLIEYTIEFLKEIKNIESITIVTGFCQEQFYYLGHKYGCKFIENIHYSDFNNMYSLYLAREELSNTYIIDADVCLLDNVFQLHETSTYYTVIRESSLQKEWTVVLNEKRIVGINITNDKKPSLLGISYFIAKDALKLKEALETVDPKLFCDPKLYYDNVIMSLLPKIEMTSTLIESDKVDELDTLDDYKRIKMKFKKNTT